MDFTSTVDDVDPVTKKISVTFSPARVAQELESAMQRVTRDARIKGFRDGKAPRAIVERMYGERVRADLAVNLIESGIRDAAKEHKLSIVGAPQVVPPKIEEGQPFVFAADVSIYPKPEITGADSFIVTVPKREVQDSEIQDVIEYLRKTRATIRPLEGRTKFAKGDVGQVEFVVTEEGGSPSKPEPYSFCLGDKQVPQEVEDSFEGMEIGESREATVAGKGAEGEERGRSVVYKGTLKSLMERILPEEDDAFAKSVEPSVQSLLELRLRIRENLEKEKKREHESDVTGAIVDQLIERNQFQVPQVLVDDEIRGMLISRGFLDPSKIDIDKLPMEMFRNELGEVALKRVRAAVAVDAIAEAESIKVEKEDIESGIADHAAARGIPVDQARRELFQNQRAVQLMVEIRRNKTLSKLRERAKVEFEGDSAAKKSKKK